jgi:hypothetical protein
MLGCPNQDLAPLEPCTVSGVSKDVPVGGVDKVDLLFVVDNSGSMAEEQVKLAVQLPRLVEEALEGVAAGDVENVWVHEMLGVANRGELVWTTRKRRSR